MPTRRVWRFKERVKPLTEFQWRFFLVQDVAGFDRLADRGGDDAAAFWFLYYYDGWREVFAAHRREIEAEWRRRGWSAKQREFVLTPYVQRDLTLRQDDERNARHALWQEWEQIEGWKTETLEQYLERNRREKTR